MGLAISEDNKVLTVEHADEDFVRAVIPKDKETFDIWLRGHDGSFYPVILQVRKKLHFHDLAFNR